MQGLAQGLAMGALSFSSAAQQSARWTERGERKSKTDGSRARRKALGLLFLLISRFLTNNAETSFPGSCAKYRRSAPFRQRLA